MTWWKLLAALAVITGGPSVTTAHVLSVTTTMAGGKLEVAAYFNEDLPADDAVVELRTPDGELVAQGKTNENGVWIGSLPPVGRYNLTVRASGDHHRTVELFVGPEGVSALPPAGGWQVKPEAVGCLFAAWVALLYWLWRRRRAARAVEKPGLGIPDQRPNA
jgi:hypothetical protein